jgi:hypothetical protein
MQDLDRRNAVHANRSARAVIQAAQAAAVIEAVVVQLRHNPDFVGFCSNDSCCLIARTAHADSVDDNWRGCKTYDQIVLS